MVLSPWDLYMFKLSFPCFTLSDADEELMYYFFYHSLRSFLLRKCYRLQTYRTLVSALTFGVIYNIACESPNVNRLNVSSSRCLHYFMCNEAILDVCPTQISTGFS